MSSQAEKLFGTQKQLLQQLTEVSAALPWEDPNYYATWCGQFFYFVAHATRLIAASASRLEMDRDNLHLRFLDHCQEEKHHEKLLLQDLKCLGYGLNQFPESPMVAQLYQSQYFLIEHRDPIALFGSVFYLEGMSLTSGLEIYHRVRKVHGEEACNFIRVHVTEDQDHIKKAEAALRPLPAESLQLIEWSLRQTASIYEAALKEFVALSKNIEKRKAA